MTGRGAAALVAGALLLAGCSSSHHSRANAPIAGPGASGASGSAIPATVGPSGAPALGPSAPPASTRPAAPAPAPVVVTGAPGPPATVSTSAPVAGDVNGDGRPDTVSVVTFGSPPVHQLTVALAGGPTLSAPVPTDEGYPPAVVGTADITGDGTSEIWLRTGQGAAATLFTAYRVLSGSLQALTINGEPAQMSVGGSVSQGNGLACRAGSAPGSGTLVLFNATSSDAKTYSVTATTYAVHGFTLVAQGATTTSASAATVGQYYRGSCGSVPFS